jgi:hypothetical protein
MQYKIFHIVPSRHLHKEADGYISFKKFTDFLEEKLKDSDTLRAKFYRFVLKHFKKNPELLTPIKISALEKYNYIFDLLEGTILPALSSEKELALALGVPMNPLFFLSTEAFQTLVENRVDDEKGYIKDFKALIKYRRKKLSYTLILERFYHFKTLVKEEMIHTRKDKTTQLTRYFSLDIDNRFIEVLHKGTLPKINVTQAQQQLTDIKSINELEKILPLSDFSFEGFSIVTAADITPKYALHKMRSIIIKHNPHDYNETYKAIVELLEQLCGKKHIMFGLLPFLKLNERLVSYYGNYSHSILINVSKKLNILESTFLEWINAYLKNPQTIIKNECTGEGKKSDKVTKAFSDFGFNGYSIIPVFYNNEVAGVLEVAAKEVALIDENLLNSIDAAIPILGQLMHQSQTEFTANINNVIRTNFTSIQSSVMWRFNEVAWNYLKAGSKDSLKRMEEIRFENVHPIYGAIDIRNSTIERNNALHKDMRYYFLLVKDILSELKVSNKNTVAELATEANNFLKQTDSFFTGNEEVLFDAFMQKVNFYLNGIKTSDAHNRNLIKKYLKETDERTGKANAKRRILENSMQYLNFIISDYLDKMQTDLQKNYPVYFEKIRTDGIEYDMYLGESISPKQPYKKTFLNELRLRQLKDMAAVTKLVYISAQTLPIPLQTTQLIYVNASSIDITFRMDEKRFDVEGVYNIRYHVVKKRIDKVHVMDSGERLTQPRKLAIIYTQPQHEKEYINYISELQQQSILKEKIELLELEELQGVTGLKAIRVEVNFD